MDALPDKLTFSVEEVARLIGVGRNSAYELARTGQLKCVSVGHRRIITRYALAEFLGMPDAPEGRPVAGPRGFQAREEGPTEWTYVVTVKRLRAGETARVERSRQP